MVDYNDLLRQSRNDPSVREQVFQFHYTNNAALNGLTDYEARTQFEQQMAIPRQENILLRMYFPEFARAAIPAPRGPGLRGIVNSLEPRTKKILATATGLMAAVGYAYLSSTPDDGSILTNIMRDGYGGLAALVAIPIATLHKIYNPTPRRP